MTERQKSDGAKAFDRIAMLGIGLHGALSSASTVDATSEPASIDVDLDSWLSGDPLVTEDPVSRYGDNSAGYVTGNGLGSLEIGAADD